MSQPWMKYDNAQKNGIFIQSNFSSMNALKKSVEKGNNPPILFIKSYGGEYDPSPAYYQGYTLEQTKSLRDYLNCLITETEKTINSVR